METLDWNGARWWKFDFHTHTPASEDYGGGADQVALKEISARDWLLHFMRAGIDCVAVTDHNSGAWIDHLRTELASLEVEEPPGFRPLHLFAGVELSTNGNTHLLAILDSTSTTADIDSLLGAVGYRGEKGASDGVTEKSLEDVVFEINRAGGVAIPAHADQAKGLFQTTQGPTLEQALGRDGLFAVEIVDPASPKPPIYLDASAKDGGWAEVVGSDSHHPPGGGAQKVPGSRFTWVKMGEPSLEGLRLALLDGPLSVRRFDEVSDPNQHAEHLLESLEVTDARYMGRGAPFRVDFNPWLNAVIGGRGTGKSTAVEFVRLALRRDDEVLDDLRPDFEKYTRAYPNREDGGLLTESTEIRVGYRKGDSRFRWQWSHSGDLDALVRQDESGLWQRVEHDPENFPVRLYSQKQIFHMAGKPLALLGVVDQAPEVGYKEWENRWREETNRFLSLRAKARELESGLADGARLEGELDDVSRRLAVFEEASHAETLKSFQRRQRQKQRVDAWAGEWSDLGDRIRRLAEELVPGPLEETLAGGDEETEQLIEKAAQARSRLESIRDRLVEMASEADAVHSDWESEKSESRWSRTVQQAAVAYQDLKERLSEEGVKDPSEYGELVQRRQTIEQQLARLERHREEAASLRQEAVESLHRLLEIRRDLTKSRKDFLQCVLSNNRYVRIEVVPYGSAEDAERELREILGRDDGAFEKDIGSAGGGGLLGRLFEDPSPAAMEDALGALRQGIRKIAEGAQDAPPVQHQFFANHLRKLPPEALDRVDLWFPQDSLEVRYSPEGDGRNFRSIREGSPGQKTAALLAFLLSYGDEPLVLDQPEDDLDNHLIYDLIVTQLREIKHRRQVVVVTHNANIVVNGDAELVVALEARDGQTQKESEGSLQDPRVRDTICEVMEGGKRAFEQRYRRIVLEGRHV